MADPDKIVYLDNLIVGKLADGSYGFLNVGSTEEMGLTMGVDAIEFVGLGGEDVFEDYFGAFSLSVWARV
jgi:hypothetical protein